MSINIPSVGTYSSREITCLIEEGQVRGDTPIQSIQIQPASLDLRLGQEAYSMPGSLLPLAGESVRSLLDRFARRRIELSERVTFERGQVVWVRLQEQFRLPEHVQAYANNKSSTGRVDVQTRVLTDGNPRYDKIHSGYQGQLWLEVIPKSFDVCLKAGDSLNQVIFYDERKLWTEKELMNEHKECGLVFDDEGKKSELKLFDHSVLMTLDLEREVVGYVAKRSHTPLDFGGLGTHAPEDFFSPIPRSKDGVLYLSQGAFYILSTYERIRVPGRAAVEMLPYDTSAGEFRAHYAGFFDPGFGERSLEKSTTTEMDDDRMMGTAAVLEVRPYEDDLIVRHRQPVCKMAYEQLTSVPEKLYGMSGNNHYAAQKGPKLSKFFK